MVDITGQLFAPLYLLLATYPRLAGGITILTILGAVMTRALVHKLASSNMEVPGLLDGQSSRVKALNTTTTAAAHTAPTTTTTTTTTEPSVDIPVAIPSTPRLEALGPVSRTSSSSTTSSDLLLPVPVTTGQSIWQGGPSPSPIPWRSSWGFLQQSGDRQGEEEETGQQQQQQRPQDQEQEHHQQARQTSQLLSSISLPTAENRNGINMDSDSCFLRLPQAAEGKAGSRRTGSMEARKGSACTYTTLGGLDDRVQQLELDIPAAAAARAREEVDSARSDLVGVGGQFS